MNAKDVAGMCLALALGMSAVAAQAMLVKSYGHGETAAAAVSDAKRQVMKDAADALLVGQGKPAVALAPTVERTRVIRTARIAPAWYEVELEAEVRMVPAHASSRLRVVLLAHPYAMDDGTTSGVVDDAAARLGATVAVDVVQFAAGPAGRLFDRVRDGAGSVPPEQRKREAADAFDLLFVLSAHKDGDGRARNTSDSQEMRTRISIIDARTEAVLAVTTVQSALMNLPTDMRAALVRDAGRQVTRLVENQAARTLRRREHKSRAPAGSGGRNGLRGGIRNGVPEVVSDGDW